MMNQRGVACSEENLYSFLGVVERCTLRLCSLVAACSWSTDSRAVAVVVWLWVWMHDMKQYRGEANLGLPPPLAGRPTPGCRVSRADQPSQGLGPALTTTLTCHLAYFGPHLAYNGPHLTYMALRGIQGRHVAYLSLLRK